MVKHTEGRKLALTIIVGVFISIMVITLVNLIVGYAYPNPEYNDFCNESIYSYPKPYNNMAATSCLYNESLDNEANACINQEGAPVYNYDTLGCTTSLKTCDMCAKEYNDVMEKHNRISFFIFAVIGFILVVFGLFASTLLLQIIALPAGAVLVIEAAVKNFDDKLAVIIVLALLVIAAVYLALKKLR